MDRPDSNRRTCTSNSLHTGLRIHFRDRNNYSKLFCNELLLFIKLFIYCNNK